MSRAQSALVGPVLVLTSTVFVLLALEGALRLSLSPTSLYGRFEHIPAFNQWRREVSFHEKYHGRPEVDFSNYDARLGWDTGIAHGRVRGGLPEERAPLRIVALGDSFVFGNEVAAEELFSAIVDDLPGVQMLNLGVPGYGIDQSYLKYEHFGRLLEPDAIVFGIFVPDYQRSTVAFTAFSKPLLDSAPSGFSWINVPVPHPAHELERINAALDGRIYLMELARNAWRRLTRSAQQEAHFFETADSIVAHLLTRLRDSLGPGQRLLILHIPRGESFLEPEAFETKMQSRLLAIYQRLGLNVINLAAEFAADTEPGMVAERYYVNRDDGAIGHLSAEGHARVAQLIMSRLDVAVNMDPP